MRGRRVLLAVKLLPYLLLSAAVWGCTAAPTIRDATAGPDGRAVVSMVAANFAFEPNTIRARKGDTLVLRVRNNAGKGHNLTVEDPEGTELVSADLPARQTVEVEVPLARSGSYAMYCNKPFHPAMGMKGVIEVP